MASLESETSDEESEFTAGENRCKYCSTLLSKDANIARHERKCLSALSNTADVVTCEDGTKRLLCDICFKLFKYLTGLKRHKKRHEPPGGFVCAYCKTKFCSSQELDKHKRDEHQVYSCQICKRVSETLSSYMEHIKSDHNGLDRIWAHCHDCGQNFKSQAIVDYHKSTKCGTVKPFKCDQCGSCYHTIATLNIHKLIHKGEKSFCCSYCGKSFLSKGQLTVHERQHTGEKPYKCEICTKAFSYRESLVTHSSLHTGIKPYVCEACQARFSCVGNLQKHRRTRPNSCGLPQFCVNKKAAPRPSNRVPGTLMMTNLKITKANKILGIKSKMKSRSDSEKEVVDTNGKLIATDENELQFDELHQDILEKTEQMEESNETQSTLQVINIEVLTDPIQEEKLEALESSGIDSHIVKTSDNNYEAMEYDNSQEARIIEEENEQHYPKKQSVLAKSAEEAAVGENDKTNEILNIESSVANHNNQSAGSEVFFVVIKDHTEHEDMEENLSLAVIKTLENQEKSSKSNENNEINSENQKEFHEISESDADDKSRDDADFNSNPSSVLNKCHLCPKVYYHRRPFLKHLRNEHRLQVQELLKYPPDKKSKKSGKYVCKVCTKSYNHQKSLEKHEICHGPDGNLVYKSAFCYKFFETENEAKEYDNVEYNDTVTCSICGKTFSNRTRLARHQRNVHDSTGKTKKKLRVCQRCGKTFTNGSSLIDHVRSYCGKSPLYKCETCYKRFHNAQSLKTHSSIHTGELPHLCTYCGKGFRTFGQVKVHQRKHNGERPFKCPDCSKAFAYRESLLTHISTHMGVKRFKCDGCDKRYSCLSNLLMHRRKTKAAKCILASVNTKPMTIGVSRGILYVGEKPNHS